jgi:hypothetical protein
MHQGIKVYLFFVFLTISSATCIHAQDTTSLGKEIKNVAKKTGHAIKGGAKKVGTKTSELAAKGKAGLVDKVYEEKEGPNGAKIYIDKASRYYWIDKKGRRHYMTAAQLKDKSA